MFHLLLSLTKPERILLLLTSEPYSASEKADSPVDLTSSASNPVPDSTPEPVYTDFEPRTKLDYDFTLYLKERKRKIQ